MATCFPGRVFNHSRVAEFGTVQQNDGKIITGIPAVDKHTADLLRLLLSRLERVTADSYWAHRASGVRGALLKTQQTIEEGRAVDPRQVERDVQAAFEILERAGREKISRSGPGYR
jgi:hypothetical protein